MNSEKKIAIIGAGASGIILMKALKEKNIAYTCFEQSSTVGGLWKYKNSHGSSPAYYGLHIDTSKTSLEFPDFKMPKEYPDYPHHSQIYEYFESLVKHFGLQESIQFKSKVTSTKQLSDGTWQIQINQRDDWQHFDYLVVCNGHHASPRWPTPAFPGKFAGIEMHSHTYKTPFEPLDFRGKKIVVVGIGNSAVDIASELSRKGIAKEVVLSTRSGAHIIPKYIFGRPADQVFQSMPFLSQKFQRWMGGKLVRFLHGDPTRFGLPRPNHELLEAHPTMSSELFLRLGGGDLIARPNIKNFDGDEVHFVDGTTFKADIIIYATGYNIDFPFLDKKRFTIVDNQFPLFKRTFLPGDPHIIFMGFAQAVPSLIKFLQIQAPLVAAYLSGEYQLPPIKIMKDTIDKDAKNHGAHFINSARHTMQIDNVLFQREIERELRIRRHLL